jgi:hypothetical protein
MFPLFGPLSHPSQPFLLGLSQQQSSPKTFESLNYLTLHDQHFKSHVWGIISFWMKDVVQIIGSITNLTQSWLINLYALQLE